MSDSYSDPQRNARNFGNYREGGRGSSPGGRGPRGREGGGFRIRLSDNEMRSARALQEAFHLRSTVAVLGFALRTLGQLLEEGKLDEVLAQHRSQFSGSNNRNDDGKHRGRSNRYEDKNSTGSGGAKPNPFARPEKPQSPVPETTTDLSKGDQIMDSSDNQGNEEEKSITSSEN